MAASPQKRSQASIARFPEPERRPLHPVIAVKLWENERDWAAYGPE